MNAKTINRMFDRTIRLIQNFEVNTSYDAKRKAKALDIVQSNLDKVKNGLPIDCGMYGKVKELTSHNSRSTITRVQAQNRSDSYITVGGKRRPLEIKTNGGRIESLYKLSNKSRLSHYVAYTLDFTVKAGKPKKDGSRKPEEHRYFSGVFTVAKFIEILESVNAIKVIGHNESDKERAIQCDSKKLYKALIASEAVEYFIDWEYFSEDFQ